MPVQPKHTLEERQQIVAKYASGISLRRLGAEYGVSYEGIRNIIKAIDPSKLGSGNVVRRKGIVEVKTQMKQAKVAKRAEKWGMSGAEYSQHVAAYGSASNRKSPMSKFLLQRRNAGYRGVGWDFTFAEWWAVWQESGKWNVRGLGGDSYVMARRNDGDTPYSKDTVYICTNKQNLLDGFTSRPASVRVATMVSNRKRNEAITGIRSLLD